jgi:hypothetical protein
MMTPRKIKHSKTAGKTRFAEPVPKWVARVDDAKFGDSRHHPNGLRLAKTPQSVSLVFLSFMESVIF